jgi:hypothetical protein
VELLQQDEEMVGVAAPEPGHAAIHEVVAAAEGSGVEGDPIS